MIRQCFTVFSGIGPGRERAIRGAGIADWQTFLDAGSAPGLSARRYQVIAEEIRILTDALTRGDAGALGEKLPRAQHWRLFEAFPGAVRYLDIETTGLSARAHDVTVVGISDGATYTVLLRGKDLSGPALQDALTGAKLLVTYYGSVFDVPFLQHAFPNVNFNLPHFDLCFAGRRVGLTGGLKAVERTLGITRPSDVDEVDGFEAVRLWRAHQRGAPFALETLIAYNQADTENLAVLARVIHERLCAKEVE